MQIAALVDGRNDAITSALYWPEPSLVQTPRSLDALPEALDKLLQDRPSAIVVQGDDAFLARLATCYHHQLLTASYQAPLYPLAVGDSQLVARALGVAQAPGKALIKLRKAIQRGKTQHLRIQTLQIALSTEPRHRLAFSVGLGQLFTLYTDARRGGRRQTIASLGARLLSSLSDRLLETDTTTTTQDARWVLDGSPLHKPPSYALLSCLPQAWFNLQMAPALGEPRLRRGDDLLELLRSSLKPRLLRSTREPERFERLLLDPARALVVDGEIITPPFDAILSVAPGPSIPLLRF